MNPDLERAAELAIQKFVETQKTTQMTIFQKSHEKPKMDFSKKLIIAVSVFYACMGIFCLVAWYLLGDWPQEIAEFFLWPIIAVASYMLKSGYENKYRIQKGDSL